MVLRRLVKAASAIRAAAAMTSGDAGAPSAIKKRHTAVQSDDRRNPPGAGWRKKLPGPTAKRPAGSTYSPSFTV